MHKENKKDTGRNHYRRQYFTSKTKHHWIKLREDRPAQAHLTAQPPKLVRMPSEYLIRKNNGIAEPFKNEKELLVLLSHKRDKAKEIISQQKRSVKNEQNLVSIIKFILEN